MTKTTVLDAHALLWYLEGNQKLSLAARQRLADPTAGLLLPTIAIAEALWILKKGQSAITSEQLQRALQRDKRFQVIPLDFELVFAAAALPDDLEMHDRMIVATAMRAA